MLVVDPWHWLEPDGSLPANKKLLPRLLRVAQFIQSAGRLLPGQARTTLIPCKRRPFCGCTIVVTLQPDGHLVGFCPSCKDDEVAIHNWESTPFAQGLPPAFAAGDIF